MNDKDIDVLNHFNLLKFKSVFNPLYLRLFRKPECAIRVLFL